MKIAFAILAHERPEAVAAVANVLCSQGDTVVIHYDARTGEAPLETLRNMTSDNAERVIFAERVHCAWGEFSLVQAELNCIEALKRHGWEGDYFYLLSGADIPIRPLAQLRAFLSARQGEEFIEATDIRQRAWVSGGLNHERYQYRFPFNERTQKQRFYAWLLIQRTLRLKRRFPAAYTPRMGSQWSVLTWPTAQAVASRLETGPFREFAKSVWIPDEMIKQTLVGHIAGEGALSQHPLTYYRFTDYGVPVVFYDDHYDFLVRQNFFFARKISPDAQDLRARLLGHALVENDGEVDPAAIGHHSGEYEKRRLSGRQNPPWIRSIGRADEGDTYTGELTLGAKTLTIMRSTATEEMDRLASLLDAECFGQFHGRVFGKDGIHFAEAAVNCAGFNRNDTDFRDRHPLRFLSAILHASPDGRTGFCLHENDDADAIASVPPEVPRMVADVLFHPVLEVVDRLEQAGHSVGTMEDLATLSTPLVRGMLEEVLSRHKRLLTPKKRPKPPAVSAKSGTLTEKASPKKPKRLIVSPMDLRGAGLSDADPTDQIALALALSNAQAGDIARQLMADSAGRLAQFAEPSFWRPLWQDVTHTDLPEEAFPGSSRSS